MRGFLVLIVVIAAALFGAYNWVPEFKAFANDKLVEFKIMPKAAEPEAAPTEAPTGDAAMAPADAAAGDAPADAPAETPTVP